MIYLTCDNCTTAIVNDDWTWIDGLGLTTEEAEEEYGRCSASVEAMGNVTLDSGHPGTDGYFQCWVCSVDALGANVFVSEEEK